jgi:hypothetical protein
MTAARHIPIADTVHTITIDSTFTPTPGGLIVQQGDTVNFQNNSNSAITIQFVPNPPGQPVSGNITINANSSGGFVAPNYDASANYDIYVGTTKESDGPYAIQVGNGPIYVQVTWNVALGVGQTNPSPVAVPLEGNLEIFSTDTTSYKASWPNTGDPFTLPSPLKEVVPGVANNLSYTATSGIAEYKFNLVKTTSSPVLGTGSGGGTVRVKGT